jgi:D-3-phosphoglycerate dehydrogenase
MSFSVVVTAPTLAKCGLQRLEDAGCRTLFVSDEGGEAELNEILRREPIDAVISRTLRLSGDAIRACPTLKVISRHGIGVNNVDVEAATQRGIPVLVARATNSQSVAELAIGLMLSVARAIPQHGAEIRAGRWNRSGQGIQLSGKTLGIIAFGAIGRAVADLALSLGMKVLAFDPAASAGVSHKEVMFSSSLEALLERANVLSIHCPWTPATHRLIGTGELARLPKRAIVINTARGGIVDEGALAAAIRSGHIAGAGLDTFEIEPLPADNPLRDLPNVVMTPHIGGTTDAALQATAAAAVDQALRFLRGEPVEGSSIVNHDALRRKELAKA